jgi:hypothetical protein
MMQRVGRDQRSPAGDGAGLRPYRIARNFKRRIHAGAENRNGVAMRGEAKSRSEKQRARAPDEQL